MEHTSVGLAHARPNYNYQDTKLLKLFVSIF